MPRVDVTEVKERKKKKRNKKTMNISNSNKGKTPHKTMQRHSHGTFIFLSLPLINFFIKN